MYVKGVLMHFFLLHLHVLNSGVTARCGSKYWIILQSNWLNRFKASKSFVSPITTVMYECVQYMRRCTWLTYIFFTVIECQPFFLFLFEYKRVCIDFIKLSELTEEAAEVDFAPVSQEVKDSFQHDCTSNFSSLYYTFPLIRPKDFFKPFHLRWFCADYIVILMPFPCNIPQEQIKSG